MTDSRGFHRFVESSKLTALNIDGFIAQSKRFDTDETSLSIFDQPGPDQALPAVEDRFQQVLEAHASMRVFNDRPIPTRSLAEVFAAAGVGAANRPLVPSAGGLDPLAIYAVVRRGEGDLDAKVVRYVHREHRVAVVGEAPAVDECRRIFNLDCNGTPAVLLVVLADPTPTLAKYGERGGRFLLQQSGHALQNVGLRLAQSQHRRRGATMHGYLVGGVLDEVRETLGVAHTRAIYLGCHAIGVT
ncbi:MAG: hypothetical protein ACI8TP_000692 [Acidimicrobiales bacterium]|jgi:hypothetical protein